ncbi:sugar-binding protein [Nonomuraea sp. NPDC049709]|uniref:sugar-binding protein n=1 Tax=Nonomuraea sp. NPDC049709 TaxID=3154736 RepID=UPI003435B1A5
MRTRPTATPTPGPTPGTPPGPTPGTVTRPAPGPAPGPVTRPTPGPTPGSVIGSVIGPAPNAATSPAPDPAPVGATTPVTSPAPGTATSAATRGAWRAPRRLAALVTTAALALLPTAPALAAPTGGPATHTASPAWGAATYASAGRAAAQSTAAQSTAVPSTAGPLTAAPSTAGPPTTALSTAASSTAALSTVAQSAEGLPAPPTGGEPTSPATSTGGEAPSTGGEAPSTGNQAASANDSTSGAATPVDLDALFVGAHPDDEAFTLSTLGQWNEDHDVRTGVVTVTRGEGGGNAVGPEEGPALGLLREAEERSAVGKAAVSEVFNLDDVDFYYTVSAPLTDQVWGGDTLEKVVRLVRQTRPEVLLTMDPAPTPGNHGNHQEAARLAVEAYYAAADPKVFPEQITREGLRPFAPARLLTGGARGTSQTGQACGSTFRPANPAQNVFGVWSGRTSAERGKTWAAVEREAQRTYASQGWAGFPDVPADPAQLGCDFFTQVDARVPFPEPGSPAAAAPTAVLDGSLTRAKGAVPLGTQLGLRTSAFDVHPGTPFTVEVTVTAPPREPLGRSSVTLRVPDGWQVAGAPTRTDGSLASGSNSPAVKGAVTEPHQRNLGRIGAGRGGSATFTVTPPSGTGAGAGGRVRIAATLTTERGGGHTDRQVELGPSVRGAQQPLPQVAQYEKWTTDVGVPQLRGLVTPVLTLPSGGTRQIGVVVTNVGGAARSGSVRLDLPAGFTADRTEAAYNDLSPGASTTVPFTVTNSDPSLKTSNEGGDYAYTITTTGQDGTSTSRPALELVPAASVPRAASAPAVDGTDGDGEYAGTALNISRLWEGTACSSAADCSGTAKVTWHDDTLYMLVHVKDDVLGTRLATSDCKRHWRTDSVEVTLDPRGSSENTSTTFKAAVLPVTAEGPPCHLRDADNRQGPGAQTAPGMRVASKVSAGEYVVEMSIPMEVLPGAVDPAHLGMNILVYDSDTQDKTGQTRIGWSTWGGVQGDPYRWGVASLPGYQPPPDRPTTPPDAVIPDTALSSLDSPQSLEQAVRVHVPLAGGPAATAAESARALTASAGQDTVQVTLRAAASGKAHLFVRDADGTAGSRVVTVPGKGTRTVTVPLTRTLTARPTVVVGWQAPSGGTAASQVPVR